MLSVCACGDISEWGSGYRCGDISEWGSGYRSGVVCIILA